MQNHFTSRPASRVLALLAICTSPVALAQTEDGLSLTASYSLQRDDNLFRLPDGVDPQAVLGRPSGAETIDISSVGLRYGKTLSLQRIELGVSLVDYRYRTYSRLDLLATNYDVTWRWALTPRLRGTLVAERDESVNSFNDTSVLTRGNQRVRRYQGFDALYELDGLWRLVGGVQSTRNQNEQPLIGEDSYTSRSADLGLRFEARSGSTVTARLRSGSGNTFNGAALPTTLRDEDYNQREQVLDVRWLLSEKTTADLNLVRFDRTHARLAIRDYSGTNTALSLRWAATAKTLWTVQWASDLSSYQTTNASYARTERLTASYLWQVAARTSLQASVSESSRRYQGSPPGQLPDPQRDTTRDASLGLRWNATRNMALNASLQHTQRTSNRPGISFSSTQAVVGVSLLTNP
ncbi:XrtB/PEP-CTERM-associated polysaccharide biosynthesis outer membrane protein EpsL [Hydrogenophaga sp.]|uniref:XrtB/PEP-CTERM-associated polysaccharide biosynthesis outer membrane protein EpsL n=1 Tax=Hydrogenophaga sp. TaxID=1904254 RepID=UPI00272F3D1F|nr:XrtB/PEP-CTERM-associated polysaccharide biosynthesis outer membrane protein EpsL [Hydrogenophaga sp.]MDP2019060.1 outer membrane beta-barrel protein [Hydrogenophaga sp.]